MLDSSKRQKILVDFRISANSVSELKRLGCDVFFTEAYPELYNAVCGHADMIMCKINGFAVAVPEFYNHLTKYADIRIFCGKTRLSGTYPHDIAYNAASVGKYLIHHLEYTDPEILKSADETINVKQGYTKCSICKVCDEAIITADNSIEKAVAGKIDVLKIRSGFVNLNTMNYGFIGGCSGLIRDNLLAFNGRIENHPDYDSIRSFCLNHHVDIISLNNDTLYDIGSIITI